MFKKFLFIFLFSTLITSCLIAKESAVFTDRWGHEYVSNEKEQLYNYIQNGCSHLLGNKFSKIDQQRRKKIYEAITLDIYYSCEKRTNAPSFTKKCVDQAIINHTINLIAEKTEERYRNSSSDWNDSKALYKKMRQHLAIESQRNYNCQQSYGLPRGFFEKSLDDKEMVQNINNIRQDLLFEQSYNTQSATNNNPYAHEGFWSSFVSLFFSSSPVTEPAPHPVSTENQNYSERPPATNPHWNPTPSAPPAQQPVSSAADKKLYPSQECSAGCMGDFKDDGLERIFLPCGHDACTSCARNWFITQGNNTCPQCRYSLLNTEKQNLKVMLDQPYGRCSCCATTDNLQTLHCKHKICTHCTAAWVINEQTQPFRSGCPRCGDHFRYR
ncbi:hypothetical protein K9K77_01665 [Candidatus Babeliales bacterium]|nr:hypothetical protein [Candidatus Babeliales bacterium]